MLAELLTPDDSRWEKALERVRHDFFHLPGYVSLEAERLAGDAVAVLLEGGGLSVLVPLVLRPVPAILGLGDASLVDAVSPYGYPGPVFEGLESASESVWRDAGKALTAELRRCGVLSAFVRLHPLLPAPPAEAVASGRFRRLGSTVFIDLAEPDEAIWRAVRPSTRNGINRTLREGYEAKVDQWDLFETFIQLYRANMIRVGADESYLFDQTYFEGLVALRDEGLHLCTVHDEGGQVTAAGLFTEVGGIVQYFLSGSQLVRKPGVSPVRLMLDHMRRWAKDRGNSLFHLGGGLAASQDSLFEFKRSFSDKTADYTVWDIVVDEERYRAAVSAWQGIGGNPGSASGYFPLYRAPAGPRHD